ncbi:TOBE domain-containing protein [Rathayibacter toxicus]|uniref:MerR family transcriptional regulator n=1 Tax=Rathayibacter toxicus TaxID=145458 RepID=A0A0C5B9X7_9MICO|nr:TOBE domain-containing protein [Rathayibacter toxicus]AJM77663.1 MerR family transcriptional regulator [Rathayibacter toxicus]ALS58171.1 MerR family transcriptional regulator [Rathayibacter toxicus]KKM44765.1 MerR family transcriptional regulator [Rathayibacter toxicus]PPG21952.1 helix-turn-helix domain-containing protein [Rathayibacter toxicus]PPG46914.1 helix-turn-helix domain-containing protein [Rathayibacter toxicus]
MPQIRIKNAADYLGVSDDTVRRWIDNGSLESTKDSSGRSVVDGLSLARLAQRNAVFADSSEVTRSARNTFVGIVTEVIVDGVMAQVEMQCGPHRVVSLMSREAVQELGVEPGSPATAVVKATMVILETARSSA